MAEISDEAASSVRASNVLLLPEFSCGPSVCVRTSRRTFARTPGDCDELYDRRADPHEQWNLADRSETDAIRRELAARLGDFLIRTSLRAAPMDKPQGPAFRVPV